MKKKLLVLAGLVTGLFIFGMAGLACATTIDVAEYANLAVGNGWTYQQSLYTEPWSVQVDSIAIKNGYNVFVLQEYDGYGFKNDQSFIEDDFSSAIYEVGGLNDYGQPTETIFYMIPPVPRLLSAFVPGQNYALDTIRDGFHLTGNLTIVKEAVTVPAGYFPDTWKVSQTIYARGTAYNFSWWYAKGMGLVKREQEDGNIWELTAYSGFTPSNLLTITNSGTGSGTVTTNSGTINWSGSTGTVSYSTGTSVMLTANANSGSTFTSWTGCDSTNGNTCIVSMTSDKSVTATFTLNSQYNLIITKSGTGTGGIISSPVGINCGDNCVASFNPGAVVTLTATPDTGSTFTGWFGGGCSGTGTCIITMNAGTTVTATFNAQTNYTYTISPTTKSFKATGGNLMIKVTGTGQNCPAPTVTISDAWLSQSGAMSWKNNAGKVKIAVQKNTSSQSRTGVVWIDGNALTIEESGAQCQLTSVKPSSGKFTNSGGTGSFNVVVNPQDCAWNVATISDWIHLDTSSGTGNGNVVFYVDTNATGKNRASKIDTSLATNVKKRKSFSLKQSK